MLIEYFIIYNRRYEKGEFTGLKRVGKSQRNFEGLRTQKNYYMHLLKISMEQENWLADQNNYHHNSREELFAK